jgi:hypothetical protein
MEYIWTPSGTDITIRWRKIGWVPPSEDPVYQAKWKYYQEMPMRYLDTKSKEQYEETLRRNKVARIK